MRSRLTFRRVLGKAWMPLVAVVAIGVGALGMWNVHRFSAPAPVYAVDGRQAPDAFTEKRLTYEVLGTGSGGKISFVDVYGHPSQVDIADLPWQHTEVTTLTVVSGSVSVQVRGGRVGCRILVNDVVRDEQADDHQDADVRCSVKSA